MYFSQKSFRVVFAIISLFISLIMSQQKAICAEDGIKVQVMGISVQRDFVYGSDLEADANSNSKEKYYGGGQQARFKTYDPYDTSEANNVVNINYPVKNKELAGHSMALSFAISGGENRIIGINKTKSIALLFKDDTGRDFIAKRKVLCDNGRTKEEIEIDPLREDFYSLEEPRLHSGARVLNVKIHDMPNPKAKTIHFIGKVIFEASSTKKDYECKNVSLAQWQTFRAGNFEFYAEYSSTTKQKDAFFDFINANWLANGNILCLGYKVSKIDKTSEDRAKICSLTFKDDAGLKIPVSTTYSEINKSFDKEFPSPQNEYLTLLFDDYWKKANITVSIWEDIKEVEVPIDVEVGLGLEEIKEEGKNKE